MKRFSRPVTACFALLGLIAWGSPARAQIEVKPVEMSIEAGPIRGYVAFVDLADPRVSVVVTKAFDRATTREIAPEADALLVATDVWAKQNDATLAVNANFFGWVKGGANIVGLDVADGVVVSEERRWQGAPDPALVFVEGDGTAPGLRARIIGPGQPEVPAKQICNAVAGVGGGEKDKTPGTLLVQAGKNLGATARVSSAQRHPRTAVGLDAESKLLIVLVVDGRQPDWSVGMTLPELADEMIRLGAHDAINLDGGGSTSFVYRPDPSAPPITNRPSTKDPAGKPGVFRPVANHLGFRVAAKNDKVGSTSSEQKPAESSRPGVGP